LQEQTVLYLKKCEFPFLYSTVELEKEVSLEWILYFNLRFITENVIKGALHRTESS